MGPPSSQDPGPAALGSLFSLTEGSPVWGQHPCHLERAGCHREAGRQVPRAEERCRWAGPAR